MLLLTFFLLGRLQGIILNGFSEKMVSPWTSRKAKKLSMLFPFLVVRWEKVLLVPRQFSCPAVPLLCVGTFQTLVLRATFVGQI